MSVPSTDRLTLGEAAYRRLRADIVSGRLAPGQRLTERSLAESTGFSVSPIRDALTRLDHDGLVRTLPRKGYQVTPLTLKSIDDLFMVWRIVGPEIARLGVRDATAEQRRQAVAVFAEIAELGTDAPMSECDRALRLVELASEAFGILAAATDNDYLVTIHRRVQYDMARAWALVSESDARTPELDAAGDWVGMLERRDGAAAAAAVEAFIAEAHGRMLRILSRWPSVVSSEITSLRG